MDQSGAAAAQLSEKVPRKFGAGALYIAGPFCSCMDINSDGNCTRDDDRCISLSVVSFVVSPLASVWFHLVPVNHTKPFTVVEESLLDSACLHRERTRNA